MATEMNAPILLNRGNSLDGRVLKKIKELGAKNVTIVGGVSSLNPYNLKITDRIAGNNRYETALKVAKFMSGEKAYIASGEIFADSLVAAPLAAKTQSPILLRAKYTVQNNIKDYVNNKTESLITVGGASTVESGIKEKKPVKIEQKNQKVQPEQKAQQEQKVQPNQKTQQEQKVQQNKKPAKKLTREENGVLYISENLFIKKRVFEKPKENTTPKKVSK